MKRDLDHYDLIPLARRTNRLPDCGTMADKSTAVRVRDERLLCMSVDDRTSRATLSARVANSDELAQANDFRTAATFLVVRVFSMSGASFVT